MAPAPGHSSPFFPPSSALAADVDSEHGACYTARLMASEIERTEANGPTRVMLEPSEGAVQADQVEQLERVIADVRAGKIGSVVVLVTEPAEPHMVRVLDGLRFRDIPLLAEFGPVVLRRHLRDARERAVQTSRGSYGG
jgi:hypothetical protein